MKMRKLFAGIAAAATLLGGMALGATSAQADGAAPTAGSGTTVTGSAKFKFTAQDAKQLTNRKLNAYKIADYVQYGTGNDAAYGVQTAAGVDRHALATALQSATNKTVPENGDLMAWALAERVLSSDSADANGAWSNSASRKFVESLKTATDKLGTARTVDLGAVAKGVSATVTLPAGLYLFVDADYLAGTNENATPSIAILVGSGSVENDVLKDPLTAANVKIKNQTTTVSKTANVTTASVGQTVTYTITSKVPQNTQYYGEYGYTYTDTPSAGQTVILDSLKVTVGGSDLNKGKDYRVIEGKNREFTVNITSIKQQNAGDEIVVTYDATVTEESTRLKAVTNRVVLSDNGATATASTSITNSGFSFTKTDAQGNPLAGAKFTINVQGVETPFTATSGKDGKVTFKGLADGTYTVNETAVPAGFQKDLKATFKVTIKDGETTFTGTDVWGLAPKNSSADYKVKNVKNVTQLPLTGAAGTTLFTVVALLVAGAGVAVALKSRQRMH